MPSKNSKLNRRKVDAGEAIERRERRIRNIADATKASEGYAEQERLDAFKRLIESDKGSAS